MSRIRKPLRNNIVLWFLIMFLPPALIWAEVWEVAKQAITIYC